MGGIQRLRPGSCRVATSRFVQPTMAWITCCSLGNRHPLVAGADRVLPRVHGAPQRAVNQTYRPKRYPKFKFISPARRLARPTRSLLCTHPQRKLSVFCFVLLEFASSGCGHRGITHHFDAIKRIIAASHSVSRPRCPPHSCCRLAPHLVGTPCSKIDLLCLVPRCREKHASRRFAAPLTRK